MVDQLAGESRMRGRDSVDPQMMPRPGRLVSWFPACSTGGAMSVLPSVLSAIAATIAAVLAGFTLYLSGRREHRQWLRNSLVDSYVNYLAASFERAGGRCSRRAWVLARRRLRECAACGRQTSVTAGTIMDHT